MLHDFTSVQSDCDITNTAISNNPFSPWTLLPSPSPEKSPRICANYIGGPWRSGENNCCILATPLAVRQPRDQTLRTVYITGQHVNLAKSPELKSARSFKQDLTALVGALESIDCKGDAVRVICLSGRWSETKASEIERNW